MKKIAALLIVTMIFTFSVGVLAANDGKYDPNLSEYVDGEILVMYVDESTATLKCSNEEELAKTLRVLAEDESVLLFQPNYRYSIAGVEVNDEYYGDQWALNNDGSFTMETYKNEFPVYDIPFTKPSLPGEWTMPGYFGLSTVSAHISAAGDGTSTTLTATAGIDINAPEAWETYNGGKREVIIAVIDTGVDYTHPELADTIWVNEDEIPDNGIDDDNNGYIDDVYGWNFFDDNNNVYDDNGHGTHCTGIIAAKANNGEGVAGIVQSDKVKIMPVKALGADGASTSESLTRAIRYAEANGALICNLSLGSFYDDRAEYHVMASSDMLFVAASGNDGVNTDVQAQYPSAYDLDNIISVANISFDGALHSLSNYGAESVDIAAPGSYILSTMPNNTYSSMSGTSMAAPMVTAASAMLYSHYDDISLADVREIIIKSAKKLNTLEGTSVSGGMLDLYAALTYDHSLLSGTQWTAREFENSAPEISAYISEGMGTYYVAVKFVDPDHDYIKAYFAEGECTAADFKNGKRGAEIALNNGMFTAYVNEGTYTFYVIDEYGNENVKVVTVKNKNQSDGIYDGISKWINDFFNIFK